MGSEPASVSRRNPDSDADAGGTDENGYCVLVQGLRVERLGCPAVHLGQLKLDDWRRVITLRAGSTVRPYLGLVGLVTSEIGTATYEHQDLLKLNCVRGTVTYTNSLQGLFRGVKGIVGGMPQGIVPPRSPRTLEEAGRAGIQRVAGDITPNAYRATMLGAYPSKIRATYRGRNGRAHRDMMRWVW